jgi:hypothetical protein
MSVIRFDPPHREVASPYHAGGWRGLLGVAVAFAVMLGAYWACLLLAYDLAQGSVAAAWTNSGSSYLADDLHAAPRRCANTVVVAAMVWPLVHYYGRRGPFAALLFALATSWLGFLSLARNAGPLEAPAQYVAYAAPTLVALMTAWRIAYRHAPPGQVTPLAAEGSKRDAA